MRIPKHTLQAFIENRVEPLLNPILSKEIIVSYYENPFNSKRKEKGRETYPVEIESKTIDVPNLFGGITPEYLTDTFKWNQIGIVKSKKANIILVECRFIGFLFFLEFVVTNKPTEAADD